MDIAASAVAFVGISGQILQGCNYLSTFFSDVEDAPDVLLALSSELNILRGRLEGFHMLLRDMQNRSPPELILQQDPASALRKCRDAIQKLQKFVDKYAALSIPAGANYGSSQTSTDIFRKTWYKLAVARKSEKLRYHRAQLEAAKASLLGAQANIQHALQLQHLNVSGEVQRDLRQLQEKHDASVQVMQETRDLATNTFTLQEEQSLFATATKASLDQVVADNQILLARSALSEQAAHDSRVTSMVTQETLASLSIDLVERFENLPTMLAATIENSIAQCLTEHNALGSTGTASKGKTSMGSLVCEESLCNDNTYSLPIRTSALRREKSSSEASSNLSIARQWSAAQASSFMLSEQLSKRGPKRQQRRTSTFNLWFAQLEINTSLTEQEDEPGSGHLTALHLRAEHTTLRLIPSLWFLRIGFLYESGHSLPTVSHPGWDNRMRVFRIHPMDSPVIEAIWDADLIRFRQLLGRREITPFDRIEHDSGVSQSLFEMVSVFLNKATRSFDSSLEKLKRGLDIARLLADSGVDCGSGDSLFWSLYKTCQKADEAATDLQLSLFRITITHSQSDPFYGLVTITNKHTSVLKDSALSLIVKQDMWDISEFKISYEQYYGKGCLQYIVENGASYSDWPVYQKQRWRCEPASSRTSRSHCLAEYGKEFVKDYWPELCWSEARSTLWQSRETCEDIFGEAFAMYIWPSLCWEKKLPSFWRSKQACEEAFGEWFVVDKWPRMYWKEELPSFWRSKQACKEAFGSEFVDWYWPKRYWKQEAPTFCYSRGKCLEVFGHSFVETEWPGWLGKSCYEFLEGKGSWQRPKRAYQEDEDRTRRVAQMTDRWERDEPALRHSRQHCVDQYGVNFVQETLPTLLRQDGLPEEDVIRLTRYGQDMEPPPLHPHLKYLRIKRVEWATQENEQDTDSDNEYDSDTDSENSEAWETADEEEA